MFPSYNSNLSTGFPSSINSDQMKCFPYGSYSWFTIPSFTPKESKLQEWKINTFEPLCCETNTSNNRIKVRFKESNFYVCVQQKISTESFPLNVNKKSRSSKIEQNNRWLEFKSLFLIATKSHFLSVAIKIIPQSSDDQVFFLYIGKLNISMNRLYGGNTCIRRGMGKGGLVVIPTASGIRVGWC